MQEVRAEIRVRFDPTVDAAYIYLVDIDPGQAVRQLSVDPREEMINIDLDSADRMLGIEVLGARRLLPSHLLEPQAPTT